MGLRDFEECPEFDFEPCLYRTLAFESHGDGLFENNTQYAHQFFDAHESSFSASIEKLLAANVEIESLGMAFLPFKEPGERLNEEIEKKIIRPKDSSGNTITKRPVFSQNKVLSDFDVAISVSGIDKRYAEELAQQLKAAEISVFYYEFYPEYL